jgi:dCMP deaminase
MSRPDVDTYFLRLAREVATRATCRRREVGCILINERLHVLATGYNGVAAGQTHCIDRACPGAHLPSGTGLELCEAIHAEANALLQCSDVHQIWSVYCTTSPCVGCVKLLMNTSAKRIVYADEYTHIHARELWLASGENAREWVRKVVY